MPIAAEFAQPATNVPEGQRQPLLLVLHGAGEFGGDDHEGQVKKHGPWVAVRSLPAHGQYHKDTITEIEKFHVLGFHGPKEGDWNGAEVNERFNDYLKKHPEVDPERVYITGFSRGGRGALRLALHRLNAKQPVAAMAVFCPEPEGYSEADIQTLRKIPIYFFHSPEDRTVHYAGTVAFQKRIGDNSSFLRTIEPNELAWPESPHVSWTSVYGPS